MARRSFSAFVILGLLPMAAHPAEAQVGGVPSAAARPTDGRASGVPAPPGTGAFAAADALFAQGRYREATAACEAALALDPAVAEAHFYLANAYDNLFVPARRGDPANDRVLHAAREHYHLAARLLVRPEQATLRIRTLQFLARLYGPDRLDRPDDARAALEEILAAEPGMVDTYFELARLHDRAGRPQDAAAIVAQAQSARPESVAVWTGTAGFLDRRGDFDGAVAALKRVLDIEPAEARHPYALATHLEARVRKTMGLPPEQARAYLLLGLEAVDRALSIRPEYFEALTYKSLLLRHRVRFATNPQLQQTLLEEADRLQRLAIEVRSRQVGRPRP